MPTTFGRGFTVALTTVTAGAFAALPAAAHAAGAVRQAPARAHAPAAHRPSTAARPRSRNSRLMTEQSVPRALRAGVTPAHTYAVTNGDDSGAGSLRAALAKAAADNTFDEITLPGSTITLTSDQLVADDPHGLLIVGKSQTQSKIVQTAAARVLEVTDGTPLSLSNVTISGGHATTTADDNSGNGGGIEVADGFLRLSSATLSGNSADLNGGGIFVGSSQSTGGSGRAVLTGVTLSGNQAVGDGGGLNAQGDVYANFLSVKGNSVTGNGSYGAGVDSGDYYNGTTQLLYDAPSFNANGLVATANTGAEYGGGMCAEGRLQLTNSIFGGSTAADGNAVTQGGGGLGAYGAAEVTLTNVVTEHNTAENYGGGFDIEYGTVAFNRVRSLSNTATSENSPTDTSAAGGYLYDVVGSIANSQFSKNSTTGFGGGLYLDNAANVAISATSITQNTAGGNGGGLMLDYYADVDLSGVTVSGNTSQSGDGGGIYLNTENVLTGRNVTISKNAADLGSNATSSGQGGGLYARSSYSELNLADSVFSGNVANQGGAAYLASASASLTGDSFTGNSATDDGLGGAIYGYSAQIELAGSAFTKNAAADASGDTNAAEGGALYLYDYTALTAANTSFTSNTADFGGAIATDEGSGVTLRSATVSGNTAQTSGGGLYNTAESSVFADNSTVSGNTVSGTKTGGLTGGGIENDGAKLTLTNDTIADNVIGTNSDGEIGAGLDNESAGSDIGDVSLVNVTLAGNRLPSNSQAAGSQLATWDGATTHLQGSIISGPSKVCTESVTVSGSAEAGTAISEGGSLATDASCGLTGPGDRVAASLKLGKLGLHGGTTQTIPLLKGSPAIKADPDCTGVGTDQRGEPRPSANCDSGAYQVVAPKVTKLSPAKGTKGTKVTITGSGLGSTTKVTFGAAKAGFAVVSDGKLVAVAPAAKKAGKVTVTVTTADGKVKAGSFTYKKK